MDNNKQIAAADNNGIGYDGTDRDIPGKSSLSAQGERGRGVLSVQVAAPAIQAGTQSTITLLIRNPFPEPVVIESIEAPTSAPLLPRAAAPTEDGDAPERSLKKRALSWLTTMEVESINVGPLVAHFPGSRSRKFNVDLAPKAKLTVKHPFGPDDVVNIKGEEGAEIVLDYPDLDRRTERNQRERTIPPHQDDIASFEIRTAHWLFVTPRTLNLFAVIKYKLGENRCSQVVPLSLSIRPPLIAIICGGVAGGVLGFLARLLTSGNTTFQLIPTALGVLGIVVMSVILSIVLSRQDNAKGFVTLEDFYGAFVVGVLLGYTGTGYFESILKGLPAQPSP